MSSPQHFLLQFRNRLSETGIQFALTSGQACVHFGIQQTTKDSDWIILPDDLAKLSTLLTDVDTSKNQSVSWRSICGAPLNKNYLGNGWTSHLAITDSDGETHHLDFFGKPPRVQTMERDANDPDFASKLVVAQMKKTDRDKDWPFVSALGRQAVADGDLRGILHGQDENWLVEIWAEVPVEQQASLVQHRPLLDLVESQPGKLRRAILMERQYWQTANRCRYLVFQKAWKEFFRQWRQEKDFEWPVKTGFLEQSMRLGQAAKKFHLPESPFDGAARLAALAEARKDVAGIFAATELELKQILPPDEVVFP